MPDCQAPAIPSPTVEAFCAWLADAVPGERFEYHRGFLSLDRSPLGNRLPDRQRRRLVEVADFAMTTADSRRVCLIQRRNGADDYSYLAVKMGGRS